MNAKLVSLLLASVIFAVSYSVLRTVVGPAMAAWRLGPKDQERPTAAVPGWGAAFDPAGDCTIEASGTTLKIGVPGTLHDLCVERGQLDAPRVLRPVEGDFAVEVTVMGPPSPDGGSTSTYSVSFQGAGLLIWLDRDNYIRFERAAILRGGVRTPYLNFEQRTRAELSFSSGRAAPDEPLTLRLERRGSQVSAAYRTAGADWVRLPNRVEVRSRDGWQAGVAAVSSATTPFLAEFQGLWVGPPRD